MAFFIVALGAALGVSMSFAQPAPASAYSGGSYLYTFNTNGTLSEAAAPSNSTSPYWWLRSGGKLLITGGLGESIQGALSSSNPLYETYASAFPQASDGGAHPQNMFRLLWKTPTQNSSEQVYLQRVTDNLGTALNRHPYDGESLIARYQDEQTYYYAGVRDDGALVIKKKVGGVFTTLAAKPFFSGTYSATTSPDLIPRGTWLGLKFSVVNSSGGAPVLSLYTDVGRSGTWRLSLSASDATGTPIPGAGLSGIDSTFADINMDNYQLTPLATSTASAPAQSGTSSGTSSSAPPPSAQSSYDSTVLSGKPVLYLPMSAAASGKESDKSGHGVVGAYKGGTPASALLPNGDTAADFNGTSEYLTVPSSASLSIPTARQLTYEAWIRPDTLSFPKASGDGYADWMGKCENYSPSCEWEARIYGAVTPENRPERISAYVFNPSAGLGSAADWQPASGIIKAGQWIHVVAEYDTTATPSACSSKYPGTINIWVDGIEQSFADHAPTGCMSQYSITPKAGNSPLDIGTMALDTYFKGAVGKVAIYDRLLSQTEINAHFQAMTGASPSGSCSVICSVSSTVTSLLSPL